MLCSVSRQFHLFIFLTLDSFSFPFPPDFLITFSVFSPLLFHVLSPLLFLLTVFQVSFSFQAHSSSVFVPTLSRNSLWRPSVTLFLPWLASSLFLFLWPNIVSESRWKRGTGHKVKIFKLFCISSWNFDILWPLPKFCFLPHLSDHYFSLLLFFSYGSYVVCPALPPLKHDIYF